MKTSPCLGEPLTPRELEVIRKVACGEEMFVPKRRLMVNLKQALAKLGVSDRAALVGAAYRTGQLPIEPSGRVPEELSPEMAEILTRIAAGESRQRIAAAMAMSKAMVDYRTRRLLSMLKASTRAQAVHLGISCRAISPSDIPGPRSLLSMETETVGETKEVLATRRPPARRSDAAERLAKARKSNSFSGLRRPGAEPSRRAATDALNGAVPFGPGDWRLKVYGTAGFSGIDVRRRPPVLERTRVLAVQGDVCLYCEIPIGTEIERFASQGRKSTRGGLVVLRRNWDHFVPYAYAVRNDNANWVIACHVCNGIKSSRMFETVADARALILPRRIAKGYEDARAVRRRLALTMAEAIGIAAIEGGYQPITKPRPPDPDETVAEPPAGSRQ